MNGGAGQVLLNVCYGPAGESTPSFTAVADVPVYLQNDVFRSYALNARITAPSTGTVKIGVCIKNQNTGMTPGANAVLGWVMVTN